VEKKDVPYKRTVFVCTNVREGRAACANPGVGGDKVCEALKHEVKRRGLKGQIRVARSGCLDRCAEGPNLFVYPEGAWYSRVSPEDVPALLEKLAE
jgi:(2Fe-2S) ferredoxin